MTLSFEVRKAGLLKGSPCAAAVLSEHPPNRRSGAALTRAKLGGLCGGLADVKQKSYASNANW